MLERQYVESIYYSYIKGKYRVNHEHVIKDIDGISSQLARKNKEPSRELIVEKLKEMYKDKEIK